jgi:hypothetical protein
MAQLHKSSVTLRIIGDDLKPDEISKQLGASPTKAQTKGDKLVGKKTGNVTIAKFGMWLLRASDREPANLDEQIHELLSQMTGDISVWKGITKRYRADLYCGLFMHVGNEGLIISAASLEALGVRGIELGLDIYDGDYARDETSA